MDTFQALRPKASASLTKSGFWNSLWERFPLKRRFCHWRTMPRQLSSMMMMLASMLYSDRVASSWTFIMKPPSPEMAQTSRSGAASLAPIAAGTP